MQIWKIYDCAEPLEECNVYLYVHVMHVESWWNIYIYMSRPHIPSHRCLKLTRRIWPVKDGTLLHLRPFGSNVFGVGILHPILPYNVCIVIVYYVSLLMKNQWISPNSHHICIKVKHKVQENSTRCVNTFQPGDFFGISMTF